MGIELNIAPIVRKEVEQNSWFSNLFFLTIDFVDSFPNFNLERNQQKIKNLWLFDIIHDYASYAYSWTAYIASYNLDNHPKKKSTTSYLEEDL